VALPLLDSWRTKADGIRHEIDHKLHPTASQNGFRA
jgi:hypothetical protein